MFRIGVPSVEKIFDDFQVTELRPLSPRDVGTKTPMSRFYLVRVPENVDDGQFLDAMRADPNVVDIQNDVMCPVAAVPNDPSYSQQWALYQTSRRDIHAPEAWEIETGSDTVIIAFIDTGVNFEHPDLINNIWVNPGEDINGNMVVYDQNDINNVDNDGNGYKDDLIGYDFFNGGDLPAAPGEDGGVKDNNPNDFNGHGTHVSGIAAAVVNNGLYGAGIAGGWGPYLGDHGVRIMPLRAGYSANDGGGYVVMSAVVEAINYAVDNGADVISYSAGSSAVTGMAQAVARAMSAGIVFCAAAGNDNADNPDYFGMYNGILAVAATNNQDRKWSWGGGSGSNFGTWVEISAPGQDIYSTYSYHYTPTYATLTGTSMAAPMVAGLAALIKSHYPQFDKTVIDTIIKNNADNIDAQNPTYIGLLGAGRINAERCLQNAPIAKFSAGPRLGPAPLAVDFTDLSPATINRTWYFGDGETSPDAAPNHVYADPGLYTVSLEVADPNGTYTKTKKFHIFATADTVYGDPSTLIPAVVSDSFPLPVYLKNTIPLKSFMLVFGWNVATGSPALTFKSTSIAGTRAQNFDTAIVRGYSPSSRKVAIEFIASMTAGSTELPAGDGLVGNLWFTSTGCGTLVMDTTELWGNYYGAKSRFVDYVPAFKTINIQVALRGDANGDGFVNAGDPVYLVNYVFKSGPPLPSLYNGDANADGTANVADAVYLISYIFKGGPPPPH